MVIDYLAHNPQHVRTVSNWIFKEFVENINNTLTFDNIIEYFGNTHIDEYPITFIAIEGGACVGTISLFKNDLKTQKELTPWLAAFCVKPECRGKRIGGLLIDKVLEKAREMGFGTLYLRTEHTSQYYVKRGWEFVYKTIDEIGQETEVYKFDLK